MGIGGGGAQLNEGVVGGGSGDLSMQPTVVSLQLSEGELPT